MKGVTVSLCCHTAARRLQISEWNISFSSVCIVLCSSKCRLDSLTRFTNSTSVFTTSYYEVVLKLRLEISWKLIILVPTLIGRRSANIALYFQIRVIFAIQTIKKKPIETLFPSKSLEFAVATCILYFIHPAFIVLPLPILVHSSSVKIGLDFD